MPPRPETGSGPGSAAAGAESAKEAPGLAESARRSQAAGMRLVNAHVELLKAELKVTGAGVGVIVGLALAALLLAFLMFLLLYVGTWLFLGEWLMGSMGWGILHGLLFTIACIVPIGLDLAGGSVGAWGRGFLIAVLTTLVLSLLFGSNVLRDAAVSSGRQLQGSLALEPALLPTLTGLAFGAVVLGVVLLAVGVRVGRPGPLVVVGAILGAAAGAILGSVTYDTRGAVAVAVTIGLITWLVATALVALRRGLDPAARYERLVPQASIDAMGDTKSFLERQLKRQRGRLMGR